eukprot:scaffold2249_cov272-Pinguiococcus_pyrenoidosus.AAC.7
MQRLTDGRCFSTRDMDLRPAVQLLALLAGLTRRPRRADVRQMFIFPQVELPAQEATPKNERKNDLHRPADGVGSVDFLHAVPVRLYNQNERSRASFPEDPLHEDSADVQLLSAWKLPVQ